MLRHYRKAMFVRHPLDRLWSAYNSKFVNQNPRFLVQYGRQMFGRFRRRHSFTDPPCIEDVTFREFVSFMMLRTSGANVHWMTYNRLCGPCELSYDYIGKLETFEADMAYLVTHVNMSGTVKRPMSASSSLEEMIRAARRMPLLSQNGSSLMLNHCLEWESFALNRFRFWRNAGFLGDDHTMEAETSVQCRIQCLDQQKANWNGYASCLWHGTVGQLLAHRANMSFNEISKRKTLAKARAYATIDHHVMSKIYIKYKLDFKLFNYPRAVTRAPLYP